MTINTHSINSLKKEELQRHIISLGEEKFRAKQLWKWLYVKGAKSFSEMTDIGKNLRLKLSDNNSIQRLKTSQHQVSVDGTQKWVFELFDGNKILGVRAVARALRARILWGKPKI